MWYNKYMKVDRFVKGVKHMSNTNTKFSEIAYMKDHKGTHIGDGIYQPEKSIRINIDTWIEEKAYTGYAIAATNYSEDGNECDIAYFTKTAYNSLSELIAKINKENNTEEYGYIINMNIPEDTMALGGGLLVEVQI